VITHPIDALIHAFDWISDKVGGPHIAPLTGLARGGKIPGFGGGDKYPALLEGGEAVVDKHRTRMLAPLFSAMGVPGFSGGGLFGSIWHGITSGFGKILDFGGVLAALATGNSGALTKDLQKLVGSGAGGAVGNLASLLTDIPKTLIKDSIHELVSFFSSSGTKGGKGSLAGIAGSVGSYAPTVLQVLRMLGQPAADLRTVLAQMTTESGGNPFAVNRWDSNWKAGTPSVGLMQVIGPTFAANAGPFGRIGPFAYGVSENPLANIYAGLHYAIGRYGPSWTNVLGHGHGYDNGGWLQSGLAFNMTGRREAVLTPAQSEAFVAVGEAARQFSRGGAQAGSALMRDVYLTLPEGATVAQALAEIDFRLKVSAQQSYLGVLP
jgi:hypothetical protein